GGWVLAIGAMRYAFLVAVWVLPWMRGTLPPRYWRKVVAATQGIVLVVASADVLPRAVSVAGLVAALALLVESFGRDVLWLWHHRSAIDHVAANRRPAVDRRPAADRRAAANRRAAADRPVAGPRRDAAAMAFVPALWSDRPSSSVHHGETI
ncbi:MAG TPA: hypothetical protein VGJ07_13415, partial [Rugosimonospora sp.]